MAGKNISRIVGGLFFILLLGIFVLSIGLAYERGHNSGYNEGWNDGTAYEKGWLHCIEENNLYERYNYGK